MADFVHIATKFEIPTDSDRIVSYSHSSGVFRDFELFF